MSEAQPSGLEGPDAPRSGQGRGPDARKGNLVLVVDPIACAGHGLCAELFPEGVGLDDWGFPIVRHAELPPELREHARRAAKACPALALRLQRAR